MVLTPEFHTLGSPLPLGPRTPEVPEVANDPRSYKALVMVFLAGGPCLRKFGQSFVFPLFWTKFEYLCQCFVMVNWFEQALIHSTCWCQ